MSANAQVIDLLREIVRLDQETDLGEVGRRLEGLAGDARTLLNSLVGSKHVG